jgi:hypothetical protein
LKALSEILNAESWRAVMIEIPSKSGYIFGFREI